MSIFEKFKINFTKTAQKQLQFLPKSYQNKILNKIDLLVSNQDSLDIKKIQGYKDLYRIKIGDYRVVYLIDSNNHIFIVSIIAHRKEVYRYLVNFFKN